MDIAVISLDSRKNCTLHSPRSPLKIFLLFFCISCSFTLVVSRGQKFLPSLTNSQNPEPNVLGPLEPEPLIKKYQEPEPLWKEIRSQSWKKTKPGSSALIKELKESILDKKKYLPFQLELSMGCILPD